MRKSIVVVLIGLAIACSNVNDSGVIPTQFARVFDQVQCSDGQSVVTAPCVTHQTARYTDYLDSARIVFNADNTMSWMWSEHSQCACYVGACSEPCSVTASLSNQTGTYEIVGDTVILTYSGSGTRKLYAKMPKRVQAGWTGPEVLTCVDCAYTTTIFMPH